MGAIIGDLAGSIYEFEQFSNTYPVKMKKLIEKDAFFSDDTILTIAILDAILSKKSYEKKLKEYGKKYENYLPKHKPYFKTIFSPNFSKWVNGDYVGISKGNGAMMRVSPVGYLFDTEEDVIKNAYLATIPSHNDELSIECAKIVSLIIFYARKGYSKEEIIEKLNLKIVKPVINEFNYTCKDTIDLCLYSLFSASSFEESIKIAISFGGDTDTNAAIVASMAEAMYGIEEEIKVKARKKLPKEFIEILDKGYELIGGDYTRCPICNQYVFKEEFDICNVCFWEHDIVQYNDHDILGANRSSLNDYKNNWEKIDSIVPKLMEKYNVTQHVDAHYKYDMLLVSRENIKQFINELTKENIACKLNFYNVCYKYKIDYSKFDGYIYNNINNVKENNDECIDIIFSNNPIEICKKHELKQLLKIIKRSKNKILKWEELTPSLTIEIE